MGTQDQASHIREQFAKIILRSPVEQGLDIWNEDIGEE
jgi:hypothetical protein